MLSASMPEMFLFMFMYVVSIALGIIALVAFIRGMRALVRIADRLERIEHALVERPLR